MDVQRLRKRGWSEPEIERAQRIFEHAEAHRHPHHARIEELSFWLLMGLALLSTIGAPLFLLPVLLFAQPAVTALVSLLLGACVGLLVVAALASLRIRRDHHQFGIGLLSIIGLALITVIGSVIAKPFDAIPGVHQDALFESVPFIIGMLGPYVASRRLHGPA